MFGVQVIMSGYFIMCAGSSPADTSATLFQPPPDLLENVPRDFPRFFLGNRQTEAQVLNRYLWHHFSTRLGHGPTLFNQEYLTTSDLWMGGAEHPGWGSRIQEIIRKDLLAIRVDADGYVHTHQHFSHAHEQGWPFPLWVHAQTGQEGYTAGWHFQNDGPGWVWDVLRQYPDSSFCREKSIEGWELHHVESLGIQENKWHLQSTGVSPTITTPENIRIDAFNAPFLQLRWIRNDVPENAVPYVEWLRETDQEFSEERRMYFMSGSGNPDYEKISGTEHIMAPMYCHPLWRGFIKRMRICLAPGQAAGKFAIDSFFTVYDTRHACNNPIYILACWNYFRWTGDVAFLQEVIQRMRCALRYQQTVMNGLKYNHIRNEWVGHDGVSGIALEPDGKKTLRYGHGIGSNYWDLLPFGWDDMYATAQYYAATRSMAELEQAILDHPEWGIPKSALSFEPEKLKQHAQKVKQSANRLFWNNKTKRFVACVDREGKSHDYGFTFLNLDAIWYGIATPQHEKAIMDWLIGKRLVEGDTSSGSDIYHWRFGPRATTRRNIDWYAHVWSAPESIPWGGQVQDGGAVLGFTFYDLIARIRVLGPDNSWQRLQEILDWEQEVWAEGGYRNYYADGKRGTTLQGGGTAGGLGIDYEFFESSLLPSAVIYGFLGIMPRVDGLEVRPNLPADCPEMGICNLLYHNSLIDIAAQPTQLDIAVKDYGGKTFRLYVGSEWHHDDSTKSRDSILISSPGLYSFFRSGSK